MKSLVELLKYPNIIEDNITEIFIQSNKEELEQGSRWYSEALSFCKELAADNNIPVMNSCALLAALSPQKEWGENKKIAKQYLKGVYKHTKVQIDKCNRIMKAKNFAECSNILGGPKTRNFFGNILYPEDPYFCTLDSHMLKCTTGLYIDRITPHQYGQLKRIFVKVSNSLNMKPVHLQGTIWLTHKRVKIKYFKQ